MVVKKKKKFEEQGGQPVTSGNADIQAREKRASQLSQGGGSVRQAQEQAMQEKRLADPEEQARIAIQQQQATAKVLAEEFPLQESTLPPIEGILKSQKEQTKSKLGEGVPLKEIPKRILTGQPLIAENPAAQLGAGVQTGAQIIDIVRAGITGRKTTSVQQAEQSFTDASKVIQTDIDLVKTGQKDYTEALRDLERAAISVNRLEEQTKGLGKVNLRFWIDKGAELEASIATEKAILEQQRVQLLAASQQAQLNSLRTQGL